MNLGPLACEASALTAELTARAHIDVNALRAGLADWEAGVERVAAEDSREHSLVRHGNDRVRTCDLALMKRPLYR